MSLVHRNDEERIIKQLRSAGVIISGGSCHFEYSSGLHGDTYLDKKLFMQAMPELFDEFCKRIAEHLANEGFGAIVAPESGGQMVAERVLSHIPKNVRIGYAPAFKGENGFYIRPEDRSKIAGLCTVVIEDVVTTAETAMTVGRLATEMGASFNAIYCLFDRGVPVSARNRKIIPVLSVELPSWEPPCRLCKLGIPLSPKPSGLPQLPFVS